MKKKTKKEIISAPLSLAVITPYISSEVCDLSISVHENTYKSKPESVHFSCIQPAQQRFQI